MSNIQIVDEFVQTLLTNPEMTMTAVALRLSATQYELKLLKADPCQMHYARDVQEQFPFQTGEGVKKQYADDFPDY